MKSDDDLGRTHPGIEPGSLAHQARIIATKLTSHMSDEILVNDISWLNSS